MERYEQALRLRAERTTAGDWRPGGDGRQEQKMGRAADEDR
ncbi:hypothetical protein [uncultured Clostridium sp.]|nr:hypothetical protein [uncultured Clostridium sp.]